MKKLTILRQQAEKISSSIQKIKGEYTAISRKAHMAMENYDMDAVKKINTDYLSLKAQYLDLTERLDKVEEKITALFKLKKIEDFDYDFEVFNVGIYRNKQHYSSKGLFLTIRPSALELTLLLAQFNNPNFSLDVEENEGYYHLRFKHFNYIENHFFDMTLSEVNQHLYWLTGITDKQRLVEELNLSIFSDNLISA